MTNQRLKIIFDGNKPVQNELRSSLQSVIVATPASGGGGGGNGGGGGGGGSWTAKTTRNG